MDLKSQKISIASGHVNAWPTSKRSGPLYHINERTCPQGSTSHNLTFSGIDHLPVRKRITLLCSVVCSSHYGKRTTCCPCGCRVLCSLRYVAYASIDYHVLTPLWGVCRTIRQTILTNKSPCRPTRQCRSLHFLTIVWWWFIVHYTPINLYEQNPRLHFLSSMMVFILCFIKILTSATD